ncbi:alpha-ketoglutarate-dependent dioxygenase alkB-like isoform X3 [Panicum virgatum]|uniref:alpha-ketoglutarate-dependent dioxygenase alkB-like isoform X3 n=1 Tax=Panicum virgatum TaxID=38727 RepID=UPI0019D57378|nr:alpha-ketoglutarate-dependent dioxygenase alkB-like isoform X3 [Panicum virgatum]
MYGASDPAAAERTAFRRAEKQYKRYKPAKLKGASRPALREAAVTSRRWLTSTRCLRPTGSCPPGSAGATAPGSTAPCSASWTGRILVEVENSDVQEKEQNNGDGKMESRNFKFVEDLEIQKGEDCRSTRATTLMRKLRWSTLGLQFDWSKRNYDVSLPHKKIPDALASLAKNMAIPAMPFGEEFKPEAAIVNYYGPSDMLGGHVDDMEADWTKPIVSISLGCKCIFLLGGKTRDEVPTAMFLRSGDIVLMAGEARERFHGVPRIFTESNQQEISALVSQLSGEDDCFILDYIKNSRININIRQVY